MNTKLRNMSLKKTLTLMFFLMLGSQKALAEGRPFGPFVEPSVLYELGDSEANFPTPLSSSSGSVNGFGIGGRLGVHVYESFFAGLDARFSMPHFEDSAVKYDAYATSFNWGPVIGMQMPDLGMRVWGSVIVGGVLDPKESGNFDVKFSDTSGYRVGVGFRVQPVSINLEYQQLEYGKTELERIGPFSSGSILNNVNFENDSWVASVSFPLEL